MLDEFPNWYLEVNSEPTNELIEARLDGIEELVVKLSSKDLPSLVLLAFGIKNQQDEYVTSFSKFFQEHDKAFRVSNNVAEHSVLAASALVRLFEDPEYSDLALQGSLSVSCISLLGRRESPANPWLFDYASTYLRSTSGQLRHRDEGCSSLKTYETFPKEKLEELKAADNWKDSVSLIFDHLNATLRVVNSQASSVSQMLLELERFQLLLEEESDILWWLLGNASRDFDKPFSEIDPKFFCLLAGKELSDLTKLPPGPVAAFDLLTAVLRLNADNLATSLTIQNSVNKASKDWVAEYSKTMPEFCVSPIFPLHTAVARSNESSKWGEAFEKVSGLSPTTKMSAKDLSFQFYRECLLAKTISSSEQ